MKIAVASEGLEVSKHFGKCSNYNCYTIANGQIVACQNMDNPARSCSQVAPLFSELDITVMMAGKISAKTKAEFEKHGIEVITGVEGMARKAVESYLDGRLAVRDRLCEEEPHCPAD